MKPSKSNTGKTSIWASEPFISIKDALDFMFKSAGLFIWFVIFILALLEIKRYYNIDLIPGYDSSVDDVYGALRGTLSDLLK